VLDTDELVAVGMQHFDQAKHIVVKLELDLAVSFAIVEQLAV
jgi:hypothetical protein